MTIESHFENHKSIIIKELSKATNKVSVAVAWINFKEYNPIFIELLDKKIKLSIICTDNPQNARYLPEINDLESKGAKIKMLKMPATNNHMHHKFAIIDDSIVLNGSFNWSKNAIKSFENIIVMKDFAFEATKFIAEFDKLWLLNTNDIKILQKKISCQKKNCRGNLYNILIFSSAHSKYYELTGDIIELCNNCLNYTTIDRYIEDNQLILLFDDYRGSSEEEINLLDNLVQKQLNSYIDNGIIIHAIGKVKKGIDWGGGETLETIILWKNKFVGDNLPNSFQDENFDVAYDNITWL